MKVPDPADFDETGLLKDLPRDDEEDFREQYESKFTDISADRVRGDLRNTVIQNARELVESVQALVGGFHPRRSVTGENSEYEFEFLSPLCELGKDGGDILLARTDYHSLHLCIVACEIGGESRQDWVQRINQIGERLRDPSHRDRLTDQLNSPERSIDTIQYITLAREVDLTEFEFSRIEHLVDVENYAVWKRDRENQEFAHCGGELAHQDLVNCLDGGLEYGQIGAPSIKYLIGSHQVLALEEGVFTLVADHRSDDDDHPQEFTRDEFRERFEQPLEIGPQGDSYNSLIDSEVDRILEFGTKIGMLSDDEEELDTPRDYDIKFSGEKPTKAKGEVVEKFLAHETPRERGRRAFELVEREFEGDYSSLGDFSS
jgi:hypothetical protein